MPQYFENDPSLEHKTVTFNYNFGRRGYSFSTDLGLFSRGHIDPESALLMSVIPPLSGSLLDMGCGYGPIGIILAGEYGLKLTAADCSSRALELAEKNAADNGIESEVIMSDCFDALEGRTFDTVTLNPPIHAGKAVTYKMYEQSIEHLTPGGRFYIVTLKKHGAESTLKKLTEVYSGRGETEVIYKKSGEYVICCRKF